MERKTYIIVVAGGNGSRMGSATPKQFLEIGGVPILQRTLERLAEAAPGARAITVLPKAWFQTWKDLCIKHSFNMPQILVEGGLTRFHSVQNALRKVPDGAIAAIHDGVRPFVSAGLVREMLSRMETERAVIPVVPVTDTLKNADPLGPDPDRSRILAAQTPQVFRSEDIKAAYGQAFSTSFTDDASVAKAYGIPLSYIGGERRNIKITAPEDLELAELFLLR